MTHLDTLSYELLDIVYNFLDIPSQNNFQLINKSFSSMKQIFYTKYITPFSLCKNINDNILKMERFKKLTIFNISNTVSKLNHLKYLKVLTLNNTIKQENISELYNLESLSICFNFGITNINHMKNLKELYAYGSHIDRRGYSKLRKVQVFI